MSGNKKIGNEEDSKVSDQGEDVQHEKNDWHPNEGKDSFRYWIVVKFYINGI